jgi:hypothetical protein
VKEPKNGAVVREPAPGDALQRLRLVHGGRLIAVARSDGENLRPEVVLA